MIQYQDVTGKDWLYLEQRKFSGFFPSDIHLAVRRKQAGGNPSLALLSAGNPLALHGTLTDMNWLSSHQLDLGYVFTALVFPSSWFAFSRVLKVAINSSSTSVATSLRIMQWSLPSIRVINFKNELSILVQYSLLQYYSFLSWKMSACFWHLVLMRFWEAWITSDY